MIINVQPENSNRTVAITYIANDISLVSKILLGYEEVLHMANKIGDNSCQSNFDKRSSNIGYFLVI
jgi:hypothetical protein